MGFDLGSDRPVLDFVATLAARHTARVEKLQEPADLARWTVEAGLLDEPPAVTPDALDAAKAVRESLFGLLTALIDGTPPDPDDRERVNAAAARPRPVLALTGAGLRRSGDVDSALAALAHDCLDLHAGPDGALLRWCADAECTRPFLDRSRGGRRRWCDMKGCGDRAKAAAYRRRRAVSAARSAP